MKLLFKIFLFVLIICSANSSYSQNIFEKILTDTFSFSKVNYGRECNKTFDGGHIITGGNLNSVLLIKINQNGDTIWSKAFSSAILHSGGYGTCARQTSDSGYIITGGWWTRDTIDTLHSIQNFLLIKTDSIGNTIWCKIYYGPNSSPQSYPGSQGNSVQQTNDGGFIAAGTRNHANSGGSPFYGDLFVIRTNINGDTLWTRLIGGSQHDVANCVIQTYDNGFIITGYSRSFLPGVSDRGYTVKLDSAGNLLWSKIYSGTIRNTEFGNILQTVDSNLIITGFLYDSLGNGGLCLIRATSAGDTLWVKTYGGVTGRSIQQTIDGGFIVSGETTDLISGNENIYLFKTNLNGDTTWTRVFADMLYDNRGSSVNQENDGGYFIGGYKHILAGGTQKNSAYIIKTDSSGNTPCSNSGIVSFGNKPFIIIASPISVVSIDTTNVENIPLIENDFGLRVTMVCPLTGIQFSNETNELSIYPNPFRESINIISNKYIQNGTLSMYSIDGVKLISKDFIGKNEVVNLKLAAGIYILQLTSDDEISTRKIIKQ